jgi:hypothetical protein
MLGTYPHTFGGLLTCYVAGIPHFRNTLAGDACYALLFFAGYALIERFSPVLRRAGTETPTMSGYGD